MPRSISTTFRQAVEAAYSSEAVIVLARIEHERLNEPLLLASNTEDVVSNGETFTGFPFELSWPDEGGDGQALGSVSIQNVDREIGSAVLKLDGPVTISLYVVLASDPDTIEIEALDLSLRTVNGDALTITGDIGIRYDLATIDYPGLRATQARCPGLWR